MDIADHISKLIDNTVPQETTDKARKKFLSYFMRILGSRLQSVNFEDPSHVKTLITRKLSSAKGSKYGTTNSDLMKFEELYNQLK